MSGILKYTHPTSGEFIEKREKPDRQGEPIPTTNSTAMLEAHRDFYKLFEVAQKIKTVEKELHHDQGERDEDKLQELSERDYS